ncbi:unnamed protein product [Blepharisma stoltei]|uniref:C3H1-type domain-containing protein n=1 Tax=Blepharisma stoltei TaxID=1481888 RepID=A0AAU9IT82_9CILI|nr:unnamed protein product [Blepharisma stoltei]
MNTQHINLSKSTSKRLESTSLLLQNEKSLYGKSNSAIRAKGTDTEFQVKYKTEMCKNWESGQCEFGNKCAFAHGIEELRNKSHKSAKPKIPGCKMYQDKGYCIYGSKCQFSHRESSPDTDSSSPDNSAFSSRRNSNEAIFRMPLFIDLESRSC